MTTSPEDPRTRQLPPVGEEPPATFEELIGTGGTPPAQPAQGLWEEEQPKPRGRWVLPAVTCVLLGAGLIVLGAGWGASQTGSEDDQPDPAAGVVVPTMPENAGGSDPERAEDPDQGGGISELVDPDWVAETSRASHIAEEALAAYAGATLSVNSSFPSCNLGWNTLAAIGYVETEHGSHGGARLGEDGAVHPTIIGPRLDGSGDFAEILDTDGGALDGDDEYDRAVGPMQFLPATWEEFGQDGSGEGTADINNIEDAALSAAVYLCSWGDMTVEGDWIDAIMGYNPSEDYNHQIAERADHYGNFG